MRENNLETIMQYVQQCEHGEHCKECCWLWKGQVATKGYGKVSYKGEKRIVHSLIFKLYYNIPLEAKIQCLHECDTPLCCNWNQIYVGDHKRNMQDRDERGRQVKGEENPLAILNNSRVYQLRRLHYSGGWTHNDLSYVFGVYPGIVQRVISHEDWSHLQGELIR